MRDYEVLTIAETAIHDEAQVQAELLDQRVTADPLHQEMELIRAMNAGLL